MTRDVSVTVCPCTRAPGTMMVYSPLARVVAPRPSAGIDTVAEAIGLAFSSRTRPEITAGSCARTAPGRSAKGMGLVQSQRNVSAISPPCRDQAQTAVATSVGFKDPVPSWTDGAGSGVSVWAAAARRAQKAAAQSCVGWATGVGRRNTRPTAAQKRGGATWTSQIIDVNSLTTLELEELGPATEAARPGNRMLYSSFVLQSCQAVVTNRCLAS